MNWIQALISNHLHNNREDPFYNFSIAIIVLISLRTVWLMIGNLLTFYEGYHICLLLVVVEDKGIDKMSIMRCNANLY